MLRFSGFAVLTSLFLFTVACDGKDGDSTSAGSEGSTSAATDSMTGTGDESDSGSGSGSDGTTIGPDPDYDRECEPDDFICDDFGCERPEVRSGECYKRCSPSEVGGVDDECDEPERPFCSQVGLAMGGDFDCNGCAHICVSASFDQCQQGAGSCGE